MREVYRSSMNQFYSVNPDPPHGSPFGMGLDYGQRRVSVHEKDGKWELLANDLDSLEDAIARTFDTYEDAEIFAREFCGA